MELTKGDEPVIVTATEFKVNLGKYLGLIGTEDVFITKNGRLIARLTDPNVSPVDALSGLLAGAVPDDFDAKQLREERLHRYAADD